MNIRRIKKQASKQTNENKKKKKNNVGLGLQNMLSLSHTDATK